MPNAIEEENEIKKMPTPLRRERAGFPSPLNRDSVLRTVQYRNGHGLVQVTYSYITIDTASFSKLSPNIMLYNFGSTLYCVKMDRIVTGSVALRVEPKMRQSSIVNLRPSSPRKDHM